VSGPVICVRPDLVILDLMLPGLDGLEVCRRVQREGAVPVLMLTARGEETDVLVGLGVGADDYMTKPFSPRELVARVRALLRRVERRPAPAGDAARIGVLKLDPASRRVTVAGEEVHLTPTEFDLLSLLAARPGTVYTREQLLADVWGWRDGAGRRTVDSHIRGLRSKLGAGLVGTVHGVGYAMAAELAGVERMRRDVVANVSHELRTPIGAPQALLENLADGVEPPDPAALRTALAQTERLGRLVEQLLDLSRAGRSAPRSASRAGAAWSWSCRGDRGGRGEPRPGRGRRPRCGRPALVRRGRALPGRARGAGARRPARGARAGVRRRRAVRGGGRRGRALGAVDGALLGARRPIEDLGEGCGSTSPWPARWRCWRCSRPAARCCSPRGGAPPGPAGLRARCSSGWSGCCRSARWWRSSPPSWPSS
jgi:DNA-binding response OmpR family regulator